MGGAGLQRPGHPHFVHSQADFGRHRVGNAHVLQRLHHVEIGLAAGDDAKARIRAVDHNAVEPVGPGELPGRVDLVPVQAQFLLQRLVGPARMDAIRRQGEILGNNDIHPLRIDIG